MILAITEEDITCTFHDVIKDHLSEILTGSKESWRHKIFNGNIFSEGEEPVGKQDLKFNVWFGDFEESQTYLMVNLIAKHFPTIKQKYITEVLLPEALIYLCCHQLKITYNQADNLLSSGGDGKVGEFLEKLWQKRKGGAKKKRVPKRQRPQADPEIEFVKRSKMDQQSILKMQRPRFQLDSNDVGIRQSAMLTDKHIQMAQELLHKQFPHIEGLLSPTIGTAQQFPVMRKNFIQVLHTGGMHWVCVSNIGCRQKNEVRLYDSLYRGISPFTKQQIAALLFIQDSDQIEVAIPPVDQQTNGTDCGVFAIAFATALCYKLDPTSLKFNRRAIRAHLWNSLQNGYIGIFPFDETSRNGLQRADTIQVYCDCRLPHNPSRDQMAECACSNKWFHQNCQKIANKVFKYQRFQWKCNHCKMA